jgi:hypothetical protein
MFVAQGAQARTGAVLHIDFYHSIERSIRILLSDGHISARRDS